MLRLAPLLLALVSICSFAAAKDDDEFVIRAIARKESLSIQEVRNVYNDGCASGITPLMLNCRYYHRISADILLNRYYAKLRKQLGKAPSGQALVRAQKAWLAYRDANCSYEGAAYVAPEYRDFSDPADKNEVIQVCVSILTEERVKLLKGYVDCPTMVCEGNAP